MDKTKYFDIVAQVEKILAAQNLGDVASEERTQVHRDMEEYVCRVPVIGGFSAGKSAFLNTLMGRDLLEEAQVPETAIATEIVYDTQEYIEAVANDGAVRRFSIDSAQSINPDAFMYLVYHVNVPYLQSRPEIVLVDMPGLDSNLERHNRAISQYIGLASAYILMISCEDGTIRASVRDFLREIQPQQNGLCCFVSKTDLRPESDVSSVVQTVENAVRATYGSNVPVVPISSDSDDQFQEKVDQALAVFDPQLLFEQHFGPIVAGIVDAGIVALENSEKALTLDTSEIDTRISEAQRKYNELVRQLDDERRKLVRTNKDKVTPQIIRDVEDALRAQADRLADALMVSAESFSSAVSSVVRRALQDADYYLRSSYEDVVEHLDLTFIADSDTLISGSVVSDAGRLAEGKTVKEKSERGQRIYQAVTSVLAIVTDFINPLLELAIILFPSIVSIFAGKQEEKKRERLIEQIRNSIVPQIVTQLRPEVEHIMDDALQTMITAVEDRVGMLLQAEQTALEQAKTDKAEQQQNLEEIRARLQSDREYLASMKMQLQVDATA